MFDVMTSILQSVRVNGMNFTSLQIVLLNKMFDIQYLGFGTKFPLRGMDKVKGVDGRTIEMPKEIFEL